MADARRRGRLVTVADTELFVDQAGSSNGYPMIVLHGGPGLDHHMFGDYLDPLVDRGFTLFLVDQRGQGRSADSNPDAWTLSKMGEDVVSLAASLRLERYAVLGHSFGALVALQNAVDFPGRAAQTILSAGFPSVRFLAGVEKQLAEFEPMELREQVAASWAAEASVRTPEQFAAIVRDQMPFHFADPLDPRIVDYMKRTEGAVYSPDVIRAFSEDYGGIELEDRLKEISQPVLVLVGRRERTCPMEASEVMAAGIPDAELVVFDHSAHMTFVEESERYVDVVADFLSRRR